MMALKYEPEIIAGTITGFCAVIAAGIAAFSSVKTARQTKRHSKVLEGLGIPTNGHTGMEMLETTEVAVKALTEGVHLCSARADQIRADLNILRVENAQEHAVIKDEQARVREELKAVNGGARKANSDEHQAIRDEQAHIREDMATDRMLRDDPMGFEA